MPQFSSQSNRSHLVRSPAKINLFLEVLGKRSDGFHELETVMVRTDLCDTLHIEAHAAGDVRLLLADNAGSTDSSSPVGTSFPLDDSNLIIQAAHALQEYRGCKRGATIRVHKKIPAQAGLGGGSGNAAAALLTLNQLWELHLPLTELHEIAATLGSDVNFLLSGYRAAVCRGRGEQICPVAMNVQQHGVLIVPPAGNSTAEIFQALQLPHECRSVSGLTDQLRDGHAVEIQTHCFNRLQAVAEQLNPDVRRTLSWLVEHTGAGFLTGSGSGCFSVLKTSIQARNLARRYRNRHEGLATAFRF